MFRRCYTSTRVTYAAWALSSNVLHEHSTLRSMRCRLPALLHYIPAIQVSHTSAIHKPSCWTCRRASAMNILVVLALHTPAPLAPLPLHVLAHATNISSPCQQVLEPLSSVASISSPCRLQVLEYRKHILRPICNCSNIASTSSPCQRQRQRGPKSKQRSTCK